jgi:hypothetical protein
MNLLNIMVAGVVLGWFMREPKKGKRSSIMNTSLGVDVIIQLVSKSGLAIEARGRAANRCSHRLPLTSSLGIVNHLQHNKTTTHCSLHSSQLCCLHILSPGSRRD